MIKNTSAIIKMMLGIATTSLRLSGTGTNGKARNTNISITRPSKTRSTTIVAKLAVMLTSSERLST